jgi:hypothetical protein
LRIWDAKSGDCIGRLPTAHNLDVFTITSHPKIDGLVVTAGNDGIICFWDMKAKRLVARHEIGDGSIVCGSFSADGKKSVFSDHLGLVHLFGFGVEYDAPKDQFFKSDWDATRIGDGGVVVDDATGIDVCLLETGPVMDMNMEAYENQPIGFDEVDSGIIEELKQERDIKAALESKRLRLEIECASVTDEKVELAKRKKAMADRAFHVEYLPEPAFVLPVDMNDLNDSDFEGDGGIQIPDEEEGSQVDFIERRDVFDGFVPSDEEMRENRPMPMRRRPPRYREPQPSGSSPVPRRHTRATRASGDDSVSSGSAEFSSADEEEIGDLDLIDDGNVIAVPKRIATGRKPKKKYAVPESEEDDIVIESPTVVKVIDLPNVEPCSFISLDTPSTSINLPQVGDQVVYFPRGHSEFLAESRLKAARSIEIEPDEGIVFARIKKIEWAVDFLVEYEDVGASSSSSETTGKMKRREACPRAKVHLELYEIDGDASSILDLNGYEIGEGSMAVDFWLEDGLEPFLVLHSSFARGVKQEFGVGDYVSPFSKEDESFDACEVIEIKDDVLWKGIGLQIERETHWYSCWDLNQSDDLGRVVADDAIEELEVQRISVLVNACMVDEEYIAFTDEVDIEWFPVYLEMIAYPIYLRLILSRLENGFYRRIGSVAEDVLVMRDNAMLFNSPSSVLHKFAKRKLKELSNRVAGMPTPPPAPRRVYKDDLFDEEDSLSGDASDFVEDEEEGGRPRRQVTRKIKKEVEGTRKSGRVRDGKGKARDSDIEIEIEEMVAPVKKKRKFVHPENDEDGDIKKRKAEEVGSPTRRAATRGKKMYVLPDVVEESSEEEVVYYQEDRGTRRSARGQRAASDEGDEVVYKEDRPKRTARAKREDEEIVFQKDRPTRSARTKNENEEVIYQEDRPTRSPRIKLNVCDIEKVEYKADKPSRTSRARVVYEGGESEEEEVYRSTRRSRRAQSADSDEEESEGEEWD